MPGCSKADKSVTETMNCYASCADFCQVFHDNMDRLYMLALLLTADREMAEHCFLSALDECVSSGTVFREWAESWARRSTIITAIRIVLRSQNPTDRQVKAESRDAISEIGFLVATVSNLPPLDRFVYVLSVLERISDKECSLLLNCSVREVVEAKARALQVKECPPSRAHPNHARESSAHSG